MLLSISIPTLNRGLRVYSLALYLGEYIKSNFPDQIELVVSDNYSTDDTLSLLDGLPPELGIKVRRRNHFIQTGEEHFLMLVEECTADFIWILGDDDIPNLHTLNTLMGYLEQNVADIYICNHREILQNGNLLTDSMLRINAAYIDMVGRETPAAVGFITTYSMFSNVVFCRKCVDIDKGRELLKLSPIYSHVAWYLVSFSDKRARIINNQLVNHRVDFKNINSYFEKYNKSKKQSEYYIWTSGLVLLLSYLIKHNYIGAQEVGFVYEHDFNGVRFRLVDQITYYIYLRLVVASKETRWGKKESLNLISEKEMQFLYSTLVSIDAALQDQMFVLMDMNRTLNSHAGFSMVRFYVQAKAYRKLHFAQKTWFMYERTFVGQAYNFELFKILNRYIAVCKDIIYLPGNKERILGQLDPREQLNLVLVETNYNDLLSRLDAMNALERQQPLLLSDEAKDADAQRKLLGSSIQRLTEDLHAMRLTNQQLVNVRVQEMEIARLSNYLLLLRLITYRTLSSLRHTWFRLERKWNRFLSR